METTDHICPYCGSKLKPPRTITLDDISKHSPIIRAAKPQIPITKDMISKHSPLIRKPFTDRMADKYGIEFLRDLHQIKDDPDFTLQAMADKHSITRERVRQICVIVYGDGWIKPKRSTRRERRKEIGCPRDPRQKLYLVKNIESSVGYATKCEYDFVQECRARGFDVSCPEDIHCDTVINGYKVDVKGPRKPFFTTRGRTPKYHSNISEYEFMCVDFVVIRHDRRQSWFIIPIKEIPNSGGIYLNIEKSDYCNARNRYWEYENAWNLLERKQDIAI